MALKDGGERGERPRLLDLFCGAGGAAMGYHRVGFEVVGVDINPQPHYPFEFVQADVMELQWLTAGTTKWAPGPVVHLEGIDAIHASPPCHDHTRSAHTLDGSGWLLGATREILAKLGRAWVIENVPGAPMRADMRLCGCMFGLPKLQRERWFETSWEAFELRPPCVHLEPAISVVGHGTPSGVNRAYRRLGSGEGSYGSLARKAMGITWMNRGELSQAIPPAYTEWIGQQLMTALEVAA